MSSQKTESETQNNSSQIKSQLDRLLKLTDVVKSFRCSKCAELQIKIRQKDQSIQQLENKHAALQIVIFESKSLFNQQTQILNKNYAKWITEFNYKIKMIQAKSQTLQNKLQNFIDKRYRRIHIEDFQQMTYQEQKLSNQCICKTQNTQKKAQHKRSEQNWDQYYVDKIIFKKLRQYQIQKQGKSNSSLAFENMKLLSQIFQQNSQIRILIQKFCYLIKIAERSSGFQNQQIEYLKQAIQFVENNVLKIQAQKSVVKDSKESVRSSAILDQYSFQREKQNKNVKR